MKRVILAAALALALVSPTLAFAGPKGTTATKEWSQMGKAERKAWVVAYARQVCKHGLVVSPADKAREDEIMSPLAFQTLVAMHVRSNCAPAPAGKTASR